MNTRTEKPAATETTKPEPAKPSGLRSKIKKRVEKTAPVLTGMEKVQKREYVAVNGKVEIGEPPEAKPQTAGDYVVVFGRVTLGHENGESIYASEGEVVELTAEEATRMVAEGVVRKAA